MQKDRLNFQNGVFLWVFHANKIPPHIGLSTNGNFFSLKASGRDDELNSNNVFKTIERKQIPSLIIELKVELETDVVRDVFSKYERTIPGDVTCLDPIKAILSCEKATKLSDLINILGERALIEKENKFYLPDDFTGIPDYDVNAIHDRLLKLENK